MCVRVTSSIANTTPPRGVLKAAARPAAAPVMIILRLEILGHQEGSQLLIVRNTEPAIWMVGPSLPTAAPPKTIIILEAILISIMRRLNNLLSLSPYLGVASSTAAITCGMPLPRAKGAYLCTSHQAIIKQTGITTNN